jgi:hypothetical protein
MRTDTTTPPVRTPITALVDRALDAWTRGLHGMDLTQLAHEAERAETLPSSPIGDRMRKAVDAELATRVGGAA